MEYGSRFNVTAGLGVRAEAQVVGLALRDKHGNRVCMDTSKHSGSVWVPSRACRSRSARPTSRACRSTSHASCAGPGSALLCRQTGLLLRMKTRDLRSPFAWSARPAPGRRLTRSSSGSTHYAGRGAEPFASCPTHCRSLQVGRATLVSAWPAQNLVLRVKLVFGNCCIFVPLRAFVFGGIVAYDLKDLNGCRHKRRNIPARLAS